MPAGGVGNGANPVQEALNDISPYLSQVPRGTGTPRVGAGSEGLPSSNVSLGPVNFGSVNVNQEASLPTTVTVNNPAPQYRPAAGFDASLQLQRQRQPSQQGIGMGVQDASRGLGGSARLGDVEHAWAQFYRDQAADYQARGLLLQANQANAMADKLQAQGTTGSTAYYGFADPNLRVDNPYMPAQYDPRIQAWHPAGTASEIMAGAYDDGYASADVYGKVITPGLSGAVDGRSNATAYDQYGFGNPYGTYQTDSPAPYEDTRGAQFNGYGLPPNNYDSSYTNAGPGTEVAWQGPNASYQPYQWPAGSSHPPASAYYDAGYGSGNTGSWGANSGVSATGYGGPWNPYSGYANYGYGDY